MKFIYRILCLFGWHIKTDERAIWIGNGSSLHAEYCSTCNKCLVELTPEMWRILGPSKMKAKP